MSKQGIVILLVLALPVGGYFYWQKQQQDKRRAAVRAAAASPAASSAGMFQGASPAAAPAAAPGAVASAAPAQLANTAAASAQPTQDAPAAAVPPSEAAASTGAAASLFSPKSGRDPMQSVADKNQILLLRTRESLDMELAARAAREAQLQNRKRRPAIESTITLQGIMEINGRLTAIVNGEMVSKGQIIKGVKVVNISNTSVTFEHKGKRFTKSVRTKAK